MWEQKYIWRNLIKVFFSRIIWPILTKLITKHCWVKEKFLRIMTIQSQKWEMFFSLLINIIIAFFQTCLMIETVSQISDVTHGPHCSPEKPVQINKQFLYHIIDQNIKILIISLVRIEWFFFWTNLISLYPRILCAKCR